MFDFNFIANRLFEITFIIILVIVLGGWIKSVWDTYFGGDSEDND